MSDAFRELLKKVGSGTHTGKDLSRTEAEAAMRMMLLQQATPAQIGAFMIAHRIKRPTAAELAGMLDAYDQLGPKLQSESLLSEYPISVLGNPYDGRSRTAPVNPITALILAAAGVPVVMHGGDCMPTKYGVPLIEIWQGLGVDFSRLSLAQVQQLLETTGFGFVYLPQHFVAANQLVPYRDQIGKRPPLATLELIWSPCAGNVHLVSGFVHPPTENLFRETLELRREPTRYTTIKGSEGSCDLACSRTAIVGVGKLGSHPSFERLHLHPRDYGFAGSDVPLKSIIWLIEQLQAILAAQTCELTPAAIWNAGFYLWNSGICSELSAGLAQAETMLTSGQVADKFKEIRQAVASFKLISNRVN